MKKLSSFLCGLAVVGMMFTSCDGGTTGGGTVTIVEDGFYVVGEASAIASLEAEGAEVAIMANGTNENASNAAREGMYEKYIALEGGKPFQLVLKEGATETVYGAELAEVKLEGNEQPNITVQRGKMVENTTMQVKESGLYHIVLDLNLDGSLEDKLILVAPVEWGVRGGMNGWGFTAGTRSEFNKTTMTYTWTDQELSAGGKFKFAYGGGWKIELNALADATDANDERYIKANTNLGENALPGGADIAVEGAGTYTITLTYNLAQGAIANSYKYEIKMTAASALPSEMYMIGDAIGGWDWAGDYIVSMTPVHSAEGAFWTIKPLEAGKPFKFCPVKDWNGDFTGLGEDSGYVVADGNCSVEADGIYMIYVDVKNKKLVVEPAAVYGIGDCFGGWDAKMEAAKFAVEGQSLKVTVPADGNLRMYAESSAATTDWWTREFNVFDGKIEFRGKGDDQAAVAVTAGQVVTLNFADNTATIQ
ncbi:MAG: SusF/SusE family outer membrane protein [Paludibacteraceae bacterium]|nr:SusF/SusE family outer membrane protein [Paludibacteraceae bacterium]